MHKKLILVIIFLAYTLASRTVSASGAQILVSGAMGNPGDVVAITVSVANNPGIAAFSLYLDFDNNMLLPIDIQPSGALSTGTFTSNLHFITGSAINELDTISAVWYRTSNIQTDGALYTVRFRIKAGAYGAIPLTLGYTIGNQNGERLTVNVQDGRIVAGDWTGEPFITGITGFNFTSGNGGAISGSIDYNIKNNTGSPFDVYVFLAIYDAMGKLIYTDINNRTITTGDNAGSFDDIDILGAGNDDYMIKIFCLDSFYQMRPLSLPAKAGFSKSV